MNDNGVYGEQQKLSFFEFMIELPNLVAVTISVILTGSLITWMDFVDSLSIVIRRGFVAVMSKKLKRNLIYQYNYGIGKVEAIASLCCEFFLISGLLCVCAFSITELINPKRPSDLLMYAVLLKVVNVSFDIFFLWRQRKLLKNSSRIVNSEYKGALQGLAFDVIALCTLFICYVNNNIRAVWYVSPIICLLVSGYFLAGSVSRIRAAIWELADRTLPEDMQLKIIKALNECYNDYADFISANSRVDAGKAHIDINVTFENDTSYADMRAFLAKVSGKIRAAIPDSVINITISE